MKSIIFSFVVLSSSLALAEPAGFQKVSCKNFNNEVLWQGTYLVTDYQHFKPMKLKEFRGTLTTGECVFENEITVTPSQDCAGYIILEDMPWPACTFDISKVNQ